MGVRSAPACGTPSSSSPPPPWPSPSSRAWDLLPPSSCNLASSPSLASLVSNLSTFPAPRGKWLLSSLTRQARPSPFSSWVSPNSSSSSHSSRGSNQLPQQQQHLAIQQQQFSLSRGKPSVSSKPAPLLHARP